MAPWHCSDDRTGQIDGVGGQQLGHRHRARDRAGVETLGSQAPRRPVRHRSGELDGLADVGQVVLDGLVDAHRRAELAAFLDVVDGHVEQLLGDADALRRSRDGGPLLRLRAMTAGSSVI